EALLRAVLRAARRGPDDPAVLALFDAQTLRGNAAAKRALWPQLRALRRGSATR
ncbi:alanine acetyltransferase, partial [Lysobacter sp. 1R34A]